MVLPDIKQGPAPATGGRGDGRLRWPRPGSTKRPKCPVYRLFADRREAGDRAGGPLPARQPVGVGRGAVAAGGSGRCSAVTAPERRRPRSWAGRPTAPLSGCRPAVTPSRSRVAGRLRRDRLGDFRPARRGEFQRAAQGVRFGVVGVVVGRATELTGCGPQRCDARVAAVPVADSWNASIAGCDVRRLGAVPGHGRTRWRSMFLLVSGRGPRAPARTRNAGSPARGRQVMVGAARIRRARDAGVVSAPCRGWGW
jgi:hypothetical protein